MTGLNYNMRPMIKIHGSSPSIGSLLGTGGSTTILQNLSSQVGKMYFGTKFDAANNEFLNKVVKPMNDSRMLIEKHMLTINNPNVFRSITTPDDLDAIPDCMKLAVLEHPVMSRLHLDGRISAWGVTPEEVDPTRPHYRVAYNNYVDDVLEASDDDGYFTIVEETCSDDPDYLFELDNQRALFDTFQFLDTYIPSTDVDPTDRTKARG